MKKIIPDKPAYPYPILPKEYFRFDASLNTSYERTEIFDIYDLRLFAKEDQRISV